jgi:predicted O-methyltransferase YrrM
MRAENSFPHGAPNGSQGFHRREVTAHGMLPLEVYQRLFEIGRASSGGTFVEIGTAHGAATIALALGALESRKPFHIFTADPFAWKRLMRSKFRSVQDHVNFVRSQFVKFNVNDHITITIGGCDDLLRSHRIAGVNILILDADGRIDRDLAALYDRLSPGCKIMIDDVDDNVYVTDYVTDTVIDQKHRLSYLLAERFQAVGLLQREGVVQDTAFFTKGTAQLTGDDISRLALSAYRELVFADVPKRTVSLREHIKDFVPSVARAVKFRLIKAYTQ